MSATPLEKTHNNLQQAPRSLLSSIVTVFLIPLFVVIGLIAYLVSGTKPVSSTEDTQRAVAQRIQKIGSVQIREANRPLSSGEDVFKAQCSACHATGVAGAPKFSDAAAWGPRIKNGFDALLKSALQGKGAMSAQGGGTFSDVEIGRAVAYMANAAGARFTAPGPTTTAASAAPVTMTPSATGADAATTASTVVGNPASSTGEALYKQACVVCHAAGVAGAPKFGDKEAWAPRLKAGTDALVQSATKGKNAMPPRGGSTASDADLRAAVEYMTNAVR